jgi:hypothetical protein
MTVTHARTQAVVAAGAGQTSRRKAADMVQQGKIDGATTFVSKARTKAEHTSGVLASGSTLANLARTLRADGVMPHTDNRPDDPLPLEARCAAGCPHAFSMALCCWHSLLCACMACHRYIRIRPYEVCGAVMPQFNLGSKEPGRCLSPQSVTMTPAGTD